MICYSSAIRSTQTEYNAHTIHKRKFSKKNNYSAKSRRQDSNSLTGFFLESFLKLSCELKFHERIANKYIHDLRNQ